MYYKNLQQEFGISILLITHDLGVVAEIADRVLVMYCGKIVEEGTVKEIFENPLHPYTKGLMDSIPELSGPRKEKLDAIPGVVPNPLELPTGCNFVTRCMTCDGKVQPRCADTSKAFFGNSVSCWNPLEKEGESLDYATTSSFS